MPLLSPWLLVLLGLLAVATPVMTYLSWSRIPGRRPVRVAARVALLASTQLTAVLLMAAVANDYGDFYGSWSELLGINSGTVGPIAVVTGGGRGASSPVGRPSTSSGQLADLGQWQPVSRSELARRGEVLHVRLGGGTGLSEDAYVWLPPQYFQRAYAHTDFPAAEVFTGFPGTAEALPAKLRYQDVLAGQVAARRTKPFVLVMLRPSVTYPRDTECIDVPKGPQAETFFAHDVVTDITSHFRVRRAGWGAMGDSTGGWCATLLAFHHPSLFRAAVSMSGYFHPLGDFTTGDLFGGSRTLQDRSNPEWILQHAAVPPIALLATGGRGERGPFGYADLVRLRDLARPPLVLSTMTLPGSAHNFRSWRAQLPADLAWLGEHLT